MMKKIDKLSQTRKVIIFILSAVFVYYDMVVQVFPGIITHQLMHDLNIKATALGILSGSYFYTYILMQLPAGILFDRFNVRYVVTLPILAAAGATYLFSLSHTLWFAILIRATMGFATAFAFLAVTRIAADLFPAKNFGILIGLAFIITSLGAMTAQLPMAILIHHMGWRHALQCVAVGGVVLSIFIWCVIRYQQPKQPKKQTLVTMFIALKRILSKKIAWLIAIISFCTWAPMVVFASLWEVPFLMRAYFLTKPEAAGLAMFTWLGLACFASIIAWIALKTKNQRWPTVITSLLGVGALICVLYVHVGSVWLLALMLFLVGATCAVQPFSYTLAKSRYSKARTSTVSGFINLAAISAGALLEPLSGKLISWDSSGILIHGAPVYSVANYQHGLTFLPILFLIAAITAFFSLKT